MADNKKYKIKVSKSEDENKNRLLYKNKSAILRKWLSVCGDVCEHGDKTIYEKCLVEAFNLTEFVMDNYIEDSFALHKKEENLKKIYKEDRKPWENGAYLLIEQGVEIDFGKLIGAGYKGKLEILELLGVVLPADIDQVRRNRNKYAHGTETYKNSIRDELDDFSKVKQFMNILGELLFVMKKIPQEMVNPDYEAMRLEVGNALGYNNRYAVLGLIGENDEIRIFEGREAKTGRDILIKEILPNPRLLEYYQKCKQHLMSVSVNGVVRTLDVILKNKACYVITERVAGDSLAGYLEQHKEDKLFQADLLYQIKKLITRMERIPNITAQFGENDLIVDAGGDVWLTMYDVSDTRMPVDKILAYYEELLKVEENETEESEEREASIEEAKTEEIKVEESEIENTEVENTEVENTEETAGSKKSEIKTEEPKIEADAQTDFVLSASSHVQNQMIRIDTDCNENNWTKLWYTLGGCGGVLLILWALSGLLA